jgi:hypothetical protein
LQVPAECMRQLAKPNGGTEAKAAADFLSL